MEFRDYQLDIIEKGCRVLLDKGLLYLSMEVRTGKTLTSLGICEGVQASNVLFITKKKAISSIQSDYYMMAPIFEIEIINYESLHKISDRKWDVIICDEAHSMGAFARASNRAKMVKKLLSKHKCKLILMSGTPTPESFSQMYHQVYGHPNNPFAGYKNFYTWAKDYVNVTQRYINSQYVNDYSKGIETKILFAMQPYMISYTQKEAGFKSVIEEEVLEVDMSAKTYSMCKRLQKSLVLEGKQETILADTSVKLMQKLHQMYSGTVIFESGKSAVLDDTKAQFIHDNFYGKKIAIFYKFKAELKALKSVFEDELTEDLEEFNTTNKSIALQIVSGREGISLKEAKYIIYYNIDFSATSYWQSRDRMTTKTRLNNKIYWVFSKGGIEHKIYKAVNKKKNYTVSHFKRDLLTL
ncbi:MAG: hypothetical protein Unbinned2299contig1000_37 [Prokaryotic dsDNA virus sp.]|mgnify:CR=1 FL=1|nr:MAG: hypothetical protein Unbinned2299contig1000_37 [Prokaryotic dsDNA virus sp.]|tara:strand:- start:1381 stop:2613 length:1233 start_codon:yes stop_codon:yes gene_type:complete